MPSGRGGKRRRGGSLGPALWPHGARLCPSAGGDSEDLFQEGMMGLLSAVRSFESGRDASFRTYAEVCIRRRLYSAIRAAQGNKHFPLNHSVSFEPPLFDGTNAYLFSSEESPEDVIIGREELRERLAALKGQLSEFEAKILPPSLSPVERSLSGWDGLKSRWTTRSSVSAGRWPGNFLPADPARADRNITPPKP